MRAALSVLLAMLLIPLSNLRADEPVKPEQLKKAYDDALVQLKAAQDRKAELAKENEALTVKAEELKKQLAASQTELNAAKRELADYDERTFFLRSYHAAWQNFIRRYPEVMARWKIYLGNSVLTVPDSLPDVLNPEWPLPMAG